MYDIKDNLIPIIISVYDYIIQFQKMEEFLIIFFLCLWLLYPLLLLSFHILQ